MLTHTLINSTPINGGGGGSASPAIAYPTLLPSNATRLERGVEQAQAYGFDLPININDVWNPDTCPAALLPYLAWAWRVDEWVDDWTDDRKRAAITDSFALHRQKGTVASIRRIMRQLGFASASIQEGEAHIKFNGAAVFDGEYKFGDPAGWAKYYIHVVDRPVTTREGDSLRRALSAVAPARCRLEEINFVSAALKFNGAARFDGSYKFGVYS